MPIHFAYGARLPSAYQEVKYIQSSGNLYINSGYTPNQDTKAELKFSNWTEVGSYDVFGTDKKFANSGFTLLSTVACYGNQTVDVSKNVADGNLHIITLGKDGYVVDGEFITAFNTQTFTSLNLYLFALNRNGSAREYAHYRFYYMKIWDNGVLVRYFIPCYRKSDNVIGLYDLVNDVFYTSSGTGTFTKGADTAAERLSRCYLGDKLLVGGDCGWEPNSNTLLYCPFMGDYINKVTNESYVSASSASLDSSGNYVNISNGWLKYNLKRDLDCSKGFTFNGFIKYASINTWNRRALSFNRKNFQSGDGQSVDIRITGTQRKNRDGVPLYTLIHYTEEVSEWRGTNRTQTDLGTWYNVCLTYDGSSEYIIQWLNGTKKICPLATLGSSPDNKIFKGLIDYIRIGVDDNNYDRMDGSVGNYIIEEGVRPDNMITSWFNKNKSIYGIS